MAVLVLLNSYPLLVSQNLVFRSKEQSMSGSIRMIQTYLTGLSRLSEENVAQALTGLDTDDNLFILVTDAAGTVLFDNRTENNRRGETSTDTVVLEALQGNDAFTCSYDSDAFFSRGASPVVYRSQTIGVVYAGEYDSSQAKLLQSFQANLLRLSVLVALLVVGLSIVLSRKLTSQISELLQAIRRVREGAYSHRAAIKGSDEIAQIGAEFNSLTDRLQTTENARRRFVSDASHEMKTPLAGIRLLTDSILQTESMDADTTREFVQDIGQEAERLSRITENLLRLTRLDSDAVEEAHPVRVAPVLERAVRMLSAVAREKETSLSYEADERAVVLATEDDVHQVIYNLIENGIKYSGAMGFVHINLRVEEDTVVLEVEDNGIGIPDEDMPHIFERFYRVDKMRSREVGGTGLGLSIVSDTVQRRGGSISVAHRPSGNGTVFTVRQALTHLPEEGENKA